MLQKLLTESAEWKFEALWKVLGVPKRLLSCLKTKTSLGKHWFMCHTQSRNIPGFSFENLGTGIWVQSRDAGILQGPDRDTNQSFMKAPMILFASTILRSSNKSWTYQAALLKKSKDWACFVIRPCLLPLLLRLRNNTAAAEPRSLLGLNLG